MKIPIIVLDTPEKDRSLMGLQKMGTGPGIDTTLQKCWEILRRAFDTSTATPILAIFTIDTASVISRNPGIETLHPYWAEPSHPSKLVGFSGITLSKILKIHLKSFNNVRALTVL